MYFNDIYVSVATLYVKGVVTASDHVFKDVGACDEPYTESAVRHTAVVCLIRVLLQRQVNVLYSKLATLLH
jgi:hypothetical protein